MIIIMNNNNMTMIMIAVAIINNAIRIICKFTKVKISRYL